MPTSSPIDTFLRGQRFAVVGASVNREKYGNKTLRAYQQQQLEVFPINPRADEVEGLVAYAGLEDLPVTVDGISIITPPAVTEKVVDQAIELGIRNIWMQPGAESPAAIERAEAAGINVIAGGPCLLVVLQFREDHD